ncbi:MAG TPA: hypothetical protein ENG03_08840 [Thioploca sp.]|nr:hypothetical protein [Thioploca sp.]
MSQFILNIDDPQLETALNEMAKKEGKSITDVIINAIQYFIKQPSTPVKKIDKELRAKLDAILASGDETEYVRHNPILKEKVERGLMAFERGEGFIVSPKQLGIQMDD